MTLHISEPGARREIGWVPTGFSLVDVFLSPIMNRSLLASLVRREIASRYRGSLLGVLWLVGSPLAMVAAYGFVMAGVFGMRMGSSGNVLETMFGLWSCLAAWQLFSETCNRSAAAITENAPLVKRTAFPLGLIPVAVLSSSAIGTLVSYLLILGVHILVVGMPPVGWALLPMAIVPLMLTSLGTAYVLATAAVFVRDVRHALPLVLQVGLLVTPVLYPADRIPPALSWISKLNPLTPMFEALRAFVLGGEWTGWRALALVAAASVAYVAAAYKIFNTFKPEFADVV